MSADELIETKKDLWRIAENLTFVILEDDIYTVRKKVATEILKIDRILGFDKLAKSKKAK